MNKIRQMSLDIVNELLKQSKDNIVNMSQKNSILSSIIQNNKGIQYILNDIKNLVQLTKINIKKLKLTDFNTEKQYDTAVTKLVNEQKKILAKLYKKIIQMNNICSIIQDTMNTLLNVYKVTQTQDQQQ